MTSTPFPAEDNPTTVLNISEYSKLNLIFNATTPFNSHYHQYCLKFSTAMIHFFQQYDIIPFANQPFEK
jgi:hypothetical protein